MLVFMASTDRDLRFYVFPIYAAGFLSAPRAESEMLAGSVKDTPIIHTILPKRPTGIK
jgi:hypothetical protein